MGIIEVKKQIRRAVYVPLETVSNAQVPPVSVDWVGSAFERQTGQPYITPAVSFSAVNILEMGPNPRFQAIGFLAVVIRTPTELLEDGNDVLTNIVAAVYPYNTDLVFGGVTVHVDKTTPGPYVPDGAWLTSLMTIDWTVYRRD